MSNQSLLVELLIKYIQTINPNLAISLECEGAHIFAVWEISPGRYAKISVSAVNSWSKLKQNIDHIYQVDNEKVGCPVCCKDDNGKVTCVQCSGVICIVCYSNVCRQGRGVYRCPFCRYETGDVVENFELEHLNNHIDARPNPGVDWQRISDNPNVLDVFTR